MSGFIEWLEKLNRKDTKVRAVLRRSLAFDSGMHIPAYPYVEPFLKGEDNYWRRKMHYLVAGLWAFHRREGRPGTPVPIAKACGKHYKATDGPASVEQRFIALLDADSGQLPHRLRQMVALLKEQDIDFGALLNDLLYWNDERKRAQNRWARDFYGSYETNIQPDTNKETSG